jgi:thermostable 8-oxoguanine DNA glycosylase
MQVIYAILDGRVRELTLPEPKEHVLPGVRWGAFDELMTPAYWRSQAWQHDALGTYDDLRLGRTLTEEVAACLLGGYGMPAELGLAAYSRLRERGLLVGAPSAHTLEKVLLEPFQYRGGRRAYRFPRQKARYLAACLARLDDLAEPTDDTDLRDVLATLPGVGLKTASWIVRNHRASNAVAIIDIHILRAGRHIGLFEPEWTPNGHYRDLEAAFLCFATAIGTRAALLDSLMWDQMRRMPSRGRLSRADRSDHSVVADTRQLDLAFGRARVG